MEEIEKDKLKNRDGEKGAALVMVLLISFLLLVACAGILLETSVNTANVSDSTADQQAYSAAESGIQSALNILRGNVAPNPLFDSTQSATAPANRIDFVKALKTPTSNLSSDTSGVPRLSRWGLTYNNNRVTIGGNANYGFNVALIDPDNTATFLTYNTTTGTSGIETTSTNVYSLSRTFGSGLNTVTITYNPASSTTANVSGSPAAANFGSFTISMPLGSLGASIPAGGVRFQIITKMTFPYTATRVIRGKILAGTITPLSVGAVKFDFDSRVLDLVGSTITLTSDPLTPNPPLTNGGVTNVTGTVTQAEPVKILIRSTGYGPRGAQKQLEAIIQGNYFNGLGAPASLTLIGVSPGFVFRPGTANNVSYSGNDVASTASIPSIGVTNTSNLTYVINNPPPTAPDPPAADITAELPDWLKNPFALDTTIRRLYEVADASGRYFRSEVSTPTSFGNNFSATGITFVDGDVDLSGPGGGILVCTGTLTLNGNVNFNGLIIVTGANGLQRSGGGGATLQGNTVVAPYVNNRIYSSTGTLVNKNGINTSTAFRAPQYDIDGGGSSNLTFNSNSVGNGLNAISNLVLGVAEN